MIGSGLTPEGILQNYVVYDFMIDMFWRPNPVNLTEWTTEYIGRRYGQIEAHSNKAWQVFKNGIYNYNGTIRLHGKYVYNIRPSTRIQTRVCIFIYTAVSPIYQLSLKKG